MADDWQVGDLALCVQGGFIGGIPGPAECFPVAGRVYTVAGAGLEGFWDGFYFALDLEDGPENLDGTRVWSASRFRKINPHAPDAEDEETIRLLNGAPCNAPSHVVPVPDKEQVS